MAVYLISECIVIVQTNMEILSDKLLWASGLEFVIQAYWSVQLGSSLETLPVWTGNWPIFLSIWRWFSPGKQHILQTPIINNQRNNPLDLTFSNRHESKQEGGLPISTIKRGHSLELFSKINLIFRRGRKIIRSLVFQRKRWFWRLWSQEDS